MSSQVLCPHCNKVNELANDEGHVEGPREYHADCWEAVVAAKEASETCWCHGCGDEVLRCDAHWHDGEAYCDGCEECESEIE